MDDAPAGAAILRARRFPLPLKLAFGFALVALTFLDRFGLPLTSSFSISPALIALYFIVLAMVLTGTAVIDRRFLFMFIAVVCVSAISFVVNSSLADQQFSSISSLGLVVMVYLPFTLVMRPEIATADRWRRLMRWYIGFAMLLAVAGILQYCAQFFINPPWLFDFRDMIPQAIRGAGTYNTSNVVGERLKANGFFLREASGFSFMMSFALICEFGLFKRRLFMAVMALAMVLSYSGSGLLAIMVAVLVSINQKTVLRIAVVAVVGVFLAAALWDVLNLSYLAGRVSEFDSTHSSAYCRFIAPGQVAFEQIDSERWSMLFGHGPGTTQKMFDICETTYGKVIFEYGLTGLTAFSLLILATTKRAGAPVRIRAVLILQWLLLGGYLLAAESLVVIFMLSSIWPSGLLSMTPPEEAA